MSFRKPRKHLCLPIRPSIMQVTEGGVFPSGASNLEPNGNGQRALHLWKEEMVNANPVISQTWMKGCVSAGKPGMLRNVKDQNHGFPHVSPHSFKSTQWIYDICLTTLEGSLLLITASNWFVMKDIATHWYRCTWTAKTSGERTSLSEAGLRSSMPNINTWSASHRNVLNIKFQPQNIPQNMKTPILWSQICIHHAFWECLTSLDEMTSHIIPIPSHHVTRESPPVPGSPTLALLVRGSFWGSANLASPKESVHRSGWVMWQY